MSLGGEERYDYENKIPRQKQCYFRVVEFLAMTSETNEVIGNQVFFHVTHDNHPDCEKYIHSCERKIPAIDEAESEFKIERIWR